MENQIIEQLTVATSKSFETMKNLGDINSSAVRKMTDLQFNFISTNMESSIEQAKSLSKKTNINDALASSTEFANDYSEKMTGFISQAVEIFTQSSDEATNLFEKTIATKAAPAKQPAKTTTVKGATKKPAKKAA